MSNSVPPVLPYLLALEDAIASRALDGQTMHAPQADWLCCLDHARERIAELEAEVSRLRVRIAEHESTAAALNYIEAMRELEVSDGVLCPE